MEHRGPQATAAPHPPGETPAEPHPPTDTRSRTPGIPPTHRRPEPSPTRAGRPRTRSAAHRHRLPVPSTFRTRTLTDPDPPRTAPPRLHPHGSRVGHPCARCSRLPQPVASRPGPRARAGSGSAGDPSLNPRPDVPRGTPRVRTGDAWRGGRPAAGTHRGTARPGEGPAPRGSRASGGAASGPTAPDPRRATDPAPARAAR
jgi:hypothetical protein